jgi:hypothetical protein
MHLPAGQSMSNAAGQATASRTFAAIPRAGHVAVADYANTHNPKLISKDGRTTWALINMPNPDIPLGKGVIDRIAPVLQAHAPPGGTVAVTGFEQLQTGGGGSGPSAFVETLIGMAGALIILALVFGSALALVPLLMAIPSILVSFLLVGGIEQFTDVSFLVQFLVALIGLGVAIDYSLLVVTRWREERERGLDNEDAVRAAGASAGHSVVLSGLTVAIGLMTLIVLPVPFRTARALPGSRQDLADRDEVAFAVSHPGRSLARALAGVVALHLRDAVVGPEPRLVIGFELDSASAQRGHCRLDVVDVDAHLGEGSRGRAAGGEERELGVAERVAQPAGSLLDRLEIELVAIERASAIEVLRRQPRRGVCVVPHVVHLSWSSSSL